MLSEYLINCKYRVGTLKPFIYLIPIKTTPTINYVVDNGEAIVMTVLGAVNKLKCANVQFISEESMDGRFKFNNKVIIKLFENQTSGLNEILNNLIQNKYNVAVEDLEGTQFICNVEFPSFVTYDYNFSSNAISPNTATVTFATDSNLPTLEIQRKITNSTLMGDYSCAYNTGAIKTLKLCDKKNTYIVRDNATFEGVYATGASDESPYKTINYLKNSFNFTENYDGQKYTDTLTFTIPLSDYKSYWQYNLIEFTQNKYVALFDTVNGNIIASGYNNGYFPSYTITTSDSIGTLNTITITLKHISEQCFAYKKSKSIDDLIDTDVRIMYTGVQPFYVNARYYPTTKCINNRQRAATMLQEITATGNKLDNYWVLEGYEEDFEGSGKNIVGTYTLTSYMEGYNIVVNDSSCASFGVCELKQRPDPIYYFDINTKSATAPIQSTCDWHIINKPSWLNLSVTSGNADTVYNLVISSNREENLSGTFTIVTGDISYNVTVNYEPLSKWVIEPGEYVCISDNSYEVYYKYTTVDGINWVKQNEVRAGNVIKTQDSRCMQYETISDTERWVLENNMYICEEDTSGGGEMVNLDDCLVYTSTDPKAYVFIDGYIKKYLLPSSNHIYIGKGFKTLQFYKSPDTDGDTVYNQGLEKIDLSHLDVSTMTSMENMFQSCRDLKEIIFGDNFNSSNVTNMDDCFGNCEKLTSINTSKINVSNVTTMQNCFRGCTNLAALDLSSWNVSKLIYLGDLFRLCTNLKLINMCSFTKAFNIGKNIFRGLSYATLKAPHSFITQLNDLAILPVSFTVEYCDEEPKRTNWLSYTIGIDDIDNLNFVNVNGTRTLLTGEGKSLGAETVITSMDFRGYRDSSNNFVNNCLNFINMSDINTSAITDMSYMFQNLTQLKGINADFDTSNVTTFKYMFSGCKELTSLNLKRFKTTACTETLAMFRNCTNLETLDLRNFDITKVTSFSNMFLHCPLRHITCTQAFKDWCNTNQTALGISNYSNITWTIIRTIKN